MNYYIQIAGKYFDELEGLHLYPSKRSLPATLWALTLFLWLAAIAAALIYPARATTWWMFSILIGTELAWLAIVMWIDKRKDLLLISVTNERFGSSFTSASECKEFVLQATVGRPPSDYLSIAEEIKDILELKSKFRKRSDVQLSEMWRSIYDRESKARLLALAIATCSIVVALSARSDASLAAVFDAYSDPGWRRLVALFAGFALTFFLSIHGFKILVLTLTDWGAFWGAKTKRLRSAFFEDGVIAYFIRDLTIYYKPSGLQSLEPSEIKGPQFSSPVPDPSDSTAEEHGLPVGSAKNDQTQSRCKVTA